MKEELDFTRKNILKIAEGIKDGSLTDEDLQKAAENTSKIIGMPVKWMGFPYEFYMEPLEKKYKQTKLFEED